MIASDNNNAAAYEEIMLEADLTVLLCRLNIDLFLYVLTLCYLFYCDCGNGYLGKWEFIVFLFQNAYTTIYLLE